MLNFFALRRLGFVLRAKRVIGQKVNFFFFAFLCVSEHFESIETHFFFENFCEHEAQNARERSKQHASANMLRQTEMPPPRGAVVSTSES